MNLASLPLLQTSLKVTGLSKELITSKKFGHASLPFTTPFYPQIEAFLFLNTRSTTLERSAKAELHLKGNQKLKMCVSHMWSPSVPTYHFCHSYDKSINHICSDLFLLHIIRTGFCSAQMVKHLPTVRETWVQSLGQEDHLEKEMTTYSSILAWKIPRMVKLGRLQSMGLQRGGHNGATFTFTFCPPNVQQTFVEFWHVWGTVSDSGDTMMDKFCSWPQEGVV